MRYIEKGKNREGRGIELAQQPNKKKEVGIFTQKLRNDEKAH